jgi:hypothetical protein
LSKRKKKKQEGDTEQTSDGAQSKTLASLPKSTEPGGGTKRREPAPGAVSSTTASTASTTSTAATASAEVDQQAEQKQTAENKSQSVSKPEVQAETKAEVKPAAKVEAKPAAKAEAKPAPEVEAQSASMPSKKIESSPVTKPAVKIQSKPISKPAAPKTSKSSAPVPAVPEAPKVKEAPPISTPWTPSQPAVVGVPVPAVVSTLFTTVNADTRSQTISSYHIESSGKRKSIFASGFQSFKESTVAGCSSCFDLVGRTFSSMSDAVVSGIKVPSYPKVELPGVIHLPKPVMPSFSLPTFKWPSFSFPSFQRSSKRASAPPVAASLVTNDALEEQINHTQNEMQKIYLKIGDLLKQNNGADQESPAVKKLIARALLLEDKINSYQRELDARKAQPAAFGSQKRTTKQRKQQANDSRQGHQYLQSVVDTTLRKSKFDSEVQMISFKKIVRDLFDKNSEIRRLAISELGRWNHSAAVPILLAYAKQNEGDTQIELINVMTQLNDPRGEEMMMRALHSNNPRTRIAALRGLYKLDGPNLNSMLIDSLRDSRAEVRKTAITFLGWRSCTDAIPGLIEMLKDAEVDVRKTAVSVLCDMRDASTVLPLIRLLDDDYPADVLTEIKISIEHVCAQKIDFNPSASRSERVQSVEKLKTWWLEFNRFGSVKSQEPKT